MVVAPDLSAADLSSKRTPRRTGRRTWRRDRGSEIGSRSFGLPARAAARRHCAGPVLAARYFTAPGPLATTLNNRIDAHLHRNFRPYSVYSGVTNDRLWNLSGQ
jgi:hypothetical protein